MLHRLYRGVNRVVRGHVRGVYMVFIYHIYGVIYIGYISTMVITMVV